MGPISYFKAIWGLRCELNSIVGPKSQKTVGLLNKIVKLGVIRGPAPFFAEKGIGAKCNFVCPLPRGGTGRQCLGKLFERFAQGARLPHPRCATSEEQAATEDPKTDQDGSNGTTHDDV